MSEPAPDPVQPTSLDAIVVSFGGAGTTALMQFLGAYVALNSWNSFRDGIKHVNSPTHPVLAGCTVRRAIYVFDDPIRALLSVFRRGMQANHMAKLTSNAHLDGAAYKAYVAAHAVPITFEEYLAAGRDQFELDAHFTNWTTAPAPFPILYVHFDALFDSGPRILDYLGLPAEHASAFPAKRERSSSIDALTDEQRATLTRLYGDLQRRIASFPRVSERGPSAQRTDA